MGRVESRRLTVTPIGYLQTDVLICGDNLARLGRLPDECIDLVYLDPPFFSNRHYEVIWGDEAEVRSFEDRWKGGIEVYTDWMRDRIRHLHRVLKPTGSIYLHCDPSASHYLKLLMDDTFGAERFRNEIIWRRTPFSGSSKARAQQLPRSHDVILFYSRGTKWTWHAPVVPYSAEYLKRFKWDDQDGRGPYRKTLLKTYSAATYERLKVDGRLIPPVKAGAKPSYKQYLAESSGERQLDDVWTDINSLNPVAKERLGYPTQKPEALLERILRASTDEGDIVLDPFCGCGTTLAVAEKLHRQWIGIDISPTAINLNLRRLRKLTTREISADGLPRTAEDLLDLKPFEFQNWVIQHVHGTQSRRKSGDLGIDGYSFFEQLPIQVKQSPGVGRNVVDNFQTAVRRDGKHKGYIFAFSFTRDAHEEAARAKRDGLEIKLVTVGELLDPADPGVDRMMADLMEAIRLARRDTMTSRLDVSAEELIASDTTATAR